MTPEEAAAAADDIEAQINPFLTPDDKAKICDAIHQLLDIIGTNPAYEATRIRLCGFITKLGCAPHAACGTGA